MSKINQKEMKHTTHFKSVNWGDCGLCALSNMLNHDFRHLGNDEDFIPSGQLELNKAFKIDMPKEERYIGNVFWCCNWEQRIDPEQIDNIFKLIDWEYPDEHKLEDCLPVIVVVQTGNTPTQLHAVSCNYYMKEGYYIVKDSLKDNCIKIKDMKELLSKCKYKYINGVFTLFNNDHEVTVLADKYLQNSL